MIVAQGAILDEFNRKLKLDHTAAVVRELCAERDGYVTRCDPRVVGEVLRDLGGGRLTKETVINHDVGVDMLGPLAGVVSFGSILGRVRAPSTTKADAA